MGELVNSIPSDSSFYKHKNIDCANCPVGNFCCTLKVKLSLIDRLRIYFATGMCTRTYANRLFDNSGWGIKLVDTGRPQRDCYFLKRDGTKAFCSIYNSRPKICRQFPHFYEDFNDCRDLLKRWKRTIVVDDKSEFIK